MNKRSYLYAIAAAYTDSEKPLEISVSHKGRWNGSETYLIYPGKIVYKEHKWQTKGNLRDIYAKIIGKMPKNKEYIFVTGRTPEGDMLSYDSRLSPYTFREFIAKNRGPDIFIEVYEKTKEEKIKKIYHGMIEHVLIFVTY